MEVNIGARVVTRDGQSAGIVDRVVIEPDTNELISIVVHFGRAPARDIVVPLGEIERATKDTIHLRVVVADLEKMPDFIESEYGPPPRQWLPPSVYPPTHVLVPAREHVDLGQPTVEEPYPRATLPPQAPHYAPPESVAISEGTEVYCVDGRVGTVDEVITDPKTNRVTSFVVRKGKGLSKDVVIPASLVSQVLVYRVVLTCRKDVLNSLPAPGR